jgi:hypothetical protein
VEKTFLYHALASGVSGKITLPFQEVIEVQGASALPFTGGYSPSRVDKFQYRELLSFSSAGTLTTGSETSDSFDTLATATIEGLNIHNVITADRIVARLASKYLKDSGVHGATFAGSHFENLRIAGKRVEIEIPAERLNSPPRSENIQFGTIAAPVKAEGAVGVELLEDGAIYVHGFGRIYFAEAVVTPSYQSLTMLRVVLGSAVKGSLTIGHASTDGEPFPP